MSYLGAWQLSKNESFKKIQKNRKNRILILANNATFLCKETVDYLQNKVELESKEYSFICMCN